MISSSRAHSPAAPAFHGCRRRRSSLAAATCEIIFNVLVCSLYNAVRTRPNGLGSFQQTIYAAYFARLLTFIQRFKTFNGRKFWWFLTDRGYRGPEYPVGCVSVCLSAVAKRLRWSSWQGGRLSRPRHCRKAAQPVPKAYVAVAVVINTISRGLSHCSQSYLLRGYIRLHIKRYSRYNKSEFT